ncbi:hypothetical protein BT93_F1577 [Corymbia citriodora subsp. variegata]|nr:hypothetical protein BT93_F1577 [Corymbia citriodora subsp. variegata]
MSYRSGRVGQALPRHPGAYYCRTVKYGKHSFPRSTAKRERRDPHHFLLPFREPRHDSARAADTTVSFPLLQDKSKPTNAEKISKASVFQRSNQFPSNNVPPGHSPNAMGNAQGRRTRRRHDTRPPDVPFPNKFVPEPSAFHTPPHNSHPAPPDPSSTRNGRAMGSSLPYAHVDSTLRSLAGQAEGFGRSAVGGLHGPLYRVTTLAGQSRASARTSMLELNRIWVVFLFFSFSVFCYFYMIIMVFFRLLVYSAERGFVGVTKTQWYWAWLEWEIC